MLNLHNPWHSHGARLPQGHGRGQEGACGTTVEAQTKPQHSAYFEEVDGRVHIVDVPVRRIARGHAQQPGFALLDGERC